MQTHIVVKENWLTRKVPARILPLTLLMVIIMIVSAFIYLGNYFNSDSWMAASGAQVFKQGEYWRLWTTLFAHGDFSHIMSNMLLFIPFAYFLAGHFGTIFFPLIGFAVGGLTNLIVLWTMPENVSLIGVSGVVYWMGAAWMTLAFFIDRRESTGRRLIRILGVSMILFLPQTFSPEVSYLSHLVGYILGVLSGLILFLCFHRRFHSAEIIEVVQEEEFSDYDDDDDNDDENGPYWHSAHT